MEKVIRNGKVAVLYAPGFGAGWSTWNNEEYRAPSVRDILLFHPKLVEMVKNDKRKSISSEWIKANFGIDDIYCGGAEDLKIKWLPEGTQFFISEYDGSESVLTSKNLIITA